LAFGESELIFQLASHKKPDSFGLFCAQVARLQSSVKLCNLANHTSREPLKLGRSKMMKLSLITLSLLAIYAHSDQVVAQTVVDNSQAAIWRATSRLGYGPTPALTQAAANSAKVWSLAQIEAAYTASQKSANVPQALQAITANANEVTVRFHEERESQRTSRANLQKPAESMQAPAPTAGAAMQPAPNQVPANMTALIDAGNVENYSRTMAQSAIAWRLASCSNPELENPLLARMTEFWFNHFNVFIDKGPVRPFVGSYLLHAIRPHALGKFEDLVLATAQHPAMLLYLDQAQSTSRGLNENYARELMELHTLGVNGGYTQDDVRTLARMLTGWSVDIAGGQAFRFRQGAHEAGSKTIMSQTFNITGQQQGMEAIRFLARHPATAQRISTRLATFFVADKPSKALVDRLKNNFLQTGGDIKSLMRTLVESPEFWDVGNTLFKTPQDFACSALAAAGPADERGEVQNFRQVQGFLGQTGQPLLRWQTPDGYKTDALTWLAPEALTRRADFAFGLSGRISEPAFLQQFYTSSTRDRIAKETAAPMRTGLLLAGPEFMMK
jgi:uncharacterized protein (DUF1800 family)